MIDTLRLASCQAPNMDFLAVGLAALIAERLGVTVEVVHGVPWDERERQLDAGAIHVGWICGLPYVRKVTVPDPPIELLAAPVMRAPRYAMRPVYFSDVVVRTDSHFQVFEDLRGASWAYNEPHSHSGYGVTCAHLAALGEDGTLFEQTVESGAHQASLDMVLGGEIDATAIDSTVLELEISRRSEIGEALRVIEVLGPSPMPPWVVHRTLPANLRAALRALFTTLHELDAGRDLLGRAGMSHLAPVTDADYDPIREMAQLGADIHL